MKANRNLLYTLVTFDPTLYVNICKIFLRSVCLFSSKDFDILIISDRQTRKLIEALPEAKALSLLYMEVAVDRDMFHALLRKLDVVNFGDFLKYRKILYLDCDIIVQDDLCKIFRGVNAVPNILYAPEEGTHDGKFWTLRTYTQADFIAMKERGTRSFNSGTFLFIPTVEMSGHFKNVKHMAESYDAHGIPHFYDQSFLNYYFNIRGMSSTHQMSRFVKMFPDSTRYYPNKILIHFTGIGDRKGKPARMKGYFGKVYNRKINNATDSKYRKTSENTRSQTQVFIGNKRKYLHKNTVLSVTTAVPSKGKGKGTLVLFFIP
jgi:Glycosyl transferase family 8